MAVNDNEIVFDSNSGISEDEQRKILEQINGIAEKNRLSLASGSDSGDGKKSKSKLHFKAKKTGMVFPVVVNIAAVAILAGGVFALSALHGITDAEVRGGRRVYDSTERVLIEEIRRETSSRLEEKENEISLITSQLEEIDAELRDLYSSNQELTEEQQAIENRLKALQEDYRTNLAGLHDERSIIIEDARAREAVLQDQLERRTRELTEVAGHNPAAIEAARAELDRLAKDQSQSAAVETQMNGLFENLSGKIAENRYDEAAELVQSMRNFIDTPSFQSLRSMQERKELYANALDAFDAMIDEALKVRSGMAPTNREAEEAEKKLADTREKLNLLEQDLHGKVIQLEKDLADKEKTITTLSSQGSNATKLLADKDSQISKLQSDLNNQTQIARQQTQAAETAQQTINTMRTQNTAQKSSLDRISNIISGRDLDNMSFNEIKESVFRIQAALEN